MVIYSFEGACFGLVWFGFCGRISLYSPESQLKCLILLSLPPKCQDYQCVPPHLAKCLQVFARRGITFL